MKIRGLDTAERHSYFDFVREHGGAFNAMAWQEKVHGPQLRYYGIFETDGQLCGVFHLYFEKHFGLTFVRNPPYIPHIGLVYRNRSSNAANALTFHKKISTHLAEFLDNLSYSVLSIALPPEMKDVQSFIWKNYKVIPNYTYRFSQVKASDVMEKCLSPEHRNSLKKAQKEGLELRRETDYAVVRDLVKKTFQRRQKGYAAATVDKILFDLADASNSFAYSAYSGGKPIAVSFCLKDEHYCYYLLGGYDEQNRHSGAGIICVWNSILEAGANQLGFDFEGSMIPEVERYFRGFGPELVPYYTINKASLPLELVLKLVKRAVF